jgi:hypothetical protein
LAKCLFLRNRWDNFTIKLYKRYPYENGRNGYKSYILRNSISNSFARLNQAKNEIVYLGGVIGNESVGAASV